METRNSVVTMGGLRSQNPQIYADKLRYFNISPIQR